MDQSSLTGFVSCLLISLRSPFSALSCDVSTCGESSARTIVLTEGASTKASSPTTITRFIKFPRRLRCFPTRRPRRQLGCDQLRPVGQRVLRIPQLPLICRLHAATADALGHASRKDLAGQ